MQTLDHYCRNKAILWLPKVLLKVTWLTAKAKARDLGLGHRLSPLLLLCLRAKRDQMGQSLWESYSPLKGAL